MDLWFSEVHTPDVKLSLRTAKQLYAGKSEWQDIEVLDTPAFGKILILNGHVLFSDADDFVYNEMTVHVPMAVHPNPKNCLLYTSFDAPVLRQDVLDIKDLVVGQKLEGVVRNVVDFGAFVDIGIHEDGLIHISHMSRKFIKHPSQVVSVGDLVTVWVKKIDTEREKVNLSLLAPDETD